MGLRGEGKARAMMACSVSRHGCLRLLAGALLAGGVVACGSHSSGKGHATGSAPSEDTGAKASAPASNNSAGAAAKQDTGDHLPDLYDPDTLPQFELTLDAAAIQVLSTVAYADKATWVHGTFTFGTTTFADVGVRLKGQSSYRNLPLKAALLVKFNKWVKGQKLHGVEEITLNNMTGDPTFIVERLAYHTFRSLGLPAVKANTAHLTINGEDYGVYANLETPDEHFLERVFGAKANTLYKVDSGSSWLPGDGGETGFAIEVADPKAPPGTKPDADLLFQAVQAANDATLLADLDARLDTKEWLRYSAAEAVTGHFDGYAFGIWGSHNYFMAGDRNAKFSLSPWSAEAAMSDREGVPDASNPLGATTLARCKLTTTCWDAYKAEVRSVLAVYETLDLVSLAHKWHDQIESLAKADPKKETTLGSHVSETELLYKWLAARPGVVRTQLGL
jgi:CotH kinase protein